jgi:hypothetical protein
MKKHLAFFVFLLLVSIQLVAGQSNLSQFSAQTAKQKAEQLNRQASAKANVTHSTRPHPYNSNPPVSALGFVSALQIPAGGSPRWTAVSADFNNDHKQDFATPVLNNDGTTFSVSVILSNGDGTFQAPKLTANPNGSYGDQILVGDVNNDGKQDLIVVHATASTFEVWLGNGDGTFNVQGNAINTITTNPLNGGVLATVNGNPVLIAVDGETPAHVWTVSSNGAGTFSQTPTSVTVTGGQLNNVVFDDFNGDGILDFAASDSASNNQTVVYLGRSNGTYVAGSPLTTTLGEYGTCNNGSGDLNGDDKPEIITANCGFGNLIVYVNNGDGTFQPGVYYSAGSNSPYVMPEAVTIADVNGDGKKDIISSNTDGSDVTVLLGNGDGTVNLPTEGYSTGGSPHTSALVADFNGDGFADIVVPDDNFSFAYLQGYGDGTFRAATDFFSPVPPPATTRAFAQVIAAADLNGDGYPDFVVGNCCDSSIGVTVFLSQPDGSLSAGVNYGSSGSLTSVAIADFNGDGIPDIAALNLGGDGVEIFTGKGDGTFTPSGSYSTGGSNANGSKNGAFNQIVTGDFNKDGHIDIAVANYSSSNVSVLLNNGTGGFLTAVPYPITGNAQTIATADVNNDGFLDLVVTDYASPGFVNVLLNQKDGTFLAAPQSPITFAFNYPGNIVLGDLDGDGKLDLVVTVGDTTNGTGLAAAKGNGDGTFQTAILFSTTQMQNIALNQPLPGDVKMGDINGDGKLDLVYSNMSSGNNADYGTIGILYNTGSAFGTGMFSTPVEYAAGSVVYSLALADVNQDGATDVVMADNYFAGVTVLLNASGSSSALASSANPAIVSQSVTFSATLAAKVRGVSAVPTGNVTFIDGSTAIGTVPLTGGLASLTTTTLAIGTHTITAQYAGDSNFHSSTSTAVSEVVTATPDFSLGATTSKVTVNAGNSGQFNFSLTSNGFTGSVTFTCLTTTVPAKAACSFSPASVALAGNNTLSTTLTISTTAATTASLAVPARPDSNPVAPTLWASLSGVGLFGFVWAGGASKKRRHMVVVLGILLLIMMFTMLGCGGSGSSSTSNQGTSVPGTPAGSYAVTVVATGSGSGAPSHTMNVTLVVQ